MKKLIMILAVTATGLLTLSFTLKSDSIGMPNPGNDVAFEIPGDVQTIIDKSCYGCHNSESSSTKGKMKLNFDKLSSLKTGKLVGKLGKISKAVTKGKMPTEKFLAKYPDRKLSKDETEKLVSWADELALKFGGE